MVRPSPRPAHPVRPPRSRVATALVGVFLGLALVLGALVPAASAATSAPPGLRATGATTTSVSLRWSAVSGAPRYRVQYATSSSMAGAHYARFTGTTATLRNLTAGRAYWFKVRVITADGGNLSPYSAAVKASTSARTASASSGSSTMRVASFNVKCFNCIGSQPNERTWWDRRDDVVATIRAQHLDVLGVQEASQAWLPAYRGGPGQNLSQFEDLANRLGDPWTLTNTNRNNCVKAWTPSSCTWADQGASKGTRILYNRDSVELLDNGSKLLTSLSASQERYMAWAVFRQRSSGKKFFFADAHLDPNKDWDLHVKEATEVASEVARRNTGHLPTLIVGDMNSHKNTLPSNGVYDVIVGKYGYVDPLGNAKGTTTGTVGATVGTRIDTWLSSYNNFTSTPTPLYYGRRPNGTYIDYIFTSRGIRVPEWETVARLDSSHHYVGQQASDHNMVRATVTLP